MSLDIKYKKEEFNKESTHKFMQVEFKRVTVTGQKHLSPFRTARLKMPQSEKVILSTVGSFVAFVGLVDFCSVLGRFGR